MARGLRLFATFALGLACVFGATGVEARAEAMAETRAAEGLRASTEALRPGAQADAAWAVLTEADAAIDRLSAPEVDPNPTLHVARSLAMLSRVAQSEPAAAARLRAAELYVRVIENANATRARFWAEGELAALQLDAGHAKEAVFLGRRALRAAVSEDDPLARFRFGDTLSRALEAANERAAAIDLARTTAALGEALRRDRLSAAIDGRATEPARDRAEDARFAGRVERATNRLLSMLLDDVERTSAQNQTALREVRDLVETMRSAELEDHFGDVCLTDQDETALDDVAGALVLYPILLEDRVALLTGFEGRFAYHRAPITPRALLDHTRALRRLLEKRTTREYRRPAEHLYDALIRPIEARIERDEVRTVVVVPDGLLRTVPFSAFHDRERRRFLVDLKPLALVPSLRLTRPVPLAGRSPAVLAAGLEASRDGFARLDHTRAEIDGLKARFPDTRVLFDASFETDRLEQELRMRPYSIVHVATHGRVDVDGRDSFLLTHDGRLGLDRLSEVIQTTRFRREVPLELLTLSACETASGDEGAALGLAGVALRAGARSALATLWPVNDEATAQLIDRFYAELTRPGQSRAGALRAAQLDVRGSPRFAHPGYWAPFLMISSWL